MFNLIFVEKVKKSFIKCLFIDYKMHPDFRDVKKWKGVDLKINEICHH